VQLQQSPVFISCITSTHIDYGINWAEQIKKHIPRARYIIFCLDQACEPLLQSKGYHAEYLREVDDGWRDVRTWYGVAKFLGALKLLERGEHIIVSDADFVVRQNVLELLNGQHDIEMQGGLWTDKDLWNHFYDKSAYNSVLCIGFMHMKPSEENKNFVREYLLRKKTYARDVWDQQLFNDMLIRNISYGSHVLPSVRVIERTLLPAGGLLMGNSELLDGAYAVHPSGASIPGKSDYKKFIFLETSVWHSGSQESRNLITVDVSENCSYGYVQAAHFLGLKWARETNRTFILPQVKCGVKSRPFFHSELFDARVFYELHSDNVLPASVAEETLIQRMISKAQHVSALSEVSHEISSPIIQLIDIPAQLSDDVSFREFISEDRFTFLKSRIMDTTKALNPPPRPQAKFFVLLMTQRVGSSWLGEILNSYPGIYWRDEILLRNETALEFLNAFLDGCRAQKPQASICGFKATLHQLQSNRNVVEIVKQLIPRFIVLRRKSVARQALSLSIAKKTNYWGCTKDTSKCRSDSDTHASPVDIANSLPGSIMYFEETYESWCYFLRNENFIEIDFEDLLAEETETITKILTYMGASELSSNNIVRIESMQKSSDAYLSHELIEGSLRNFSSTTFARLRGVNYLAEFREPDSALSRRCPDFRHTPENTAALRVHECTFQEFISYDVDGYLNILSDLQAKLPSFNPRHQEGSMHHSEMLFIASYLRVLRPEVVFESGVFKGTSSAVFMSFIQSSKVAIEYVLAAFPFVPEQLKMAVGKIFPKAVIVEGGGQNVVKTLDKKKSTVAIIDGPKASVPGESTAWTQLMDELRQFHNVSAMFFHDSRREMHSENLVELVKYYQKHFVRDYNLCFMSTSVLGKLFPVLELGGDAKHDGVPKLPMDLPSGHISQLLSSRVSNLAFLIKRE